MTASRTDERLRQVAAALAAPDRHIPPTAPTGIDPAALRRAVGLFRSAVFAGYFDPRPVEELLAGTLRYSAGANCDHHSHDHHHGGGGCGGHCHN